MSLTWFTGCTSDDEPENEPPVSAQFPPAEAPGNLLTTPPTGDPVQDAAVRGWMGFLDAQSIATLRLDPDVPEIPIFADLVAEEDLEVEIADLIDNERRISGPVTVSPDVQFADAGLGGDALLLDCLDRTQQVELDFEGDVTRAAGFRGRTAVEVRLARQLTSSVWQVYEITQTGPC